MASKKPQDFGYQSYCEMYDSLKSKGVKNHNDTIKLASAANQYAFFNGTDTEFIHRVNKLINIMSII